LINKDLDLFWDHLFDSGQSPFGFCIVCNEKFGKNGSAKYIRALHFNFSKASLHCLFDRITFEESEAFL